MHHTRDEPVAPGPRREGRYRGETRRKSLRPRSLRAAFDDRSIECGIIVADRHLIACQTSIEGTFVHPFVTSSCFSASAGRTGRVRSPQ